jgi:ferredoxin
VREGLALVEPPGELERDLLDTLKERDPAIRLGCQLVIRAGDGRVKLWVTL